MEWRASIIVGVNVAAHDQDGIVNVDGTFTCSDEALETVLVELLAYVFIPSDLKAASRNVRMLNLLIL